MRKTLKAVMGLCVLLGVFFVTSSAPSGAQEDCGYFGCEEPCEFAGTFPGQVVSGGKITVSGTSTDVDSIEFAIDGKVIGSVTPDEDGDWSGTFDVPSLSPGTYSITATASSDCGEFSDEQDIQVLAAGVDNDPNDDPNNIGNSTGSSDTPLARTGFDAAPMVTLGAAALVLGAAAVYGSKRRTA